LTTIQLLLVCMRTIYMHIRGTEREGKREAERGTGKWELVINQTK